MPLGSLWWQVLVATAAVFVVSALIHMVLRYHRSDYKQLPNEDAVAEVIRKGGPAPGLYALPYCVDMSKMKDPAVQKKYADGPVGLLAVMRSGAPSMGKPLVLWAIFCFLITFTAAYVARHSLAPGAPHMTVARVTAAVAFAGYGLGQLPNSVWAAIPWSNTLRSIVDAIIYAIVTGVIFAMTWPGMP